MTLATLSRRSLAVLAGLLLAVGSIEGALRLVGARLFADRAAATGEGRSILCLGDSNVYGLFVPREEAYPAVLEARLRGAGDDALRVVNAGQPGLDSRGAALRLERILAKERPALVLLTVGANDHWRWVGAVERDPPWYEGLLLVRFARLLAASAEWSVGDAERDKAVEGELPTRGDGEGLELDERVDAIRGSLERMARGLAERGIPLVLVGYAAHASTYEIANDVMAEFAARRGLTFVETARAAQAFAADHGFDATYFPDLHPRAAGYAVVAREVHRALATAGHVGPGGSGPDDDGDIALATPDALSIEVELQGSVTAARVSEDEWRLALRGGPSRGRARLTLFGLRSAPRDREALDLETDPLHLFCVERGGVRVVFDDAGEALVSLANVRDFVPVEDWLGRWFSVWVLPVDEGLQALPAPPPREVRVER